ncbi:hypothetical protein GALMADRAFT_228968 [Galerina marginata CBS 339.88]|uniref:Major facilitator superfamily (MFS) profile domain-containing protein n=1 Tax=Galerina marginata (strain CBS 339.88) TaxID=685588 RepID=A0A067SYB8_GALM3|nr:hypothetical protein GALMADRAFT_228968 [Galerina marginata CBS 339.88]
MTSAYSLGQRRTAALAEVDNAKYTWFHFRVCAVAGIGFFTDAYDIFSIGIASTMLGYVYGRCDHTTVDPTVSSLTTTQDLALKVATPIGTVIGQIMFGWLADKFGRRKMYGIELMIIIFATIAQVVLPRGSFNIIGALTAFRFIMGIGIGGGYPLSAVMSSEFASTAIRGRMMTSVFSCQGWGSLASAIVAFVLTNAFKNSILNSIQNSDSSSAIPSIDVMWRLLIGLGVIPGCFALYFRLTIPESPRFTMDIQGNIRQASRDIKSIFGGTEYIPVSEDDEETIQRLDIPTASWEDLRSYFGQLKNFKVLFGAAYSWFALDIAFYCLNLNMPIILQAISFGRPNSYDDSKSSCSGLTEGVFHSLLSSCFGNLIVSAAALVPGYWVSFLLIDSWGRKPIQLMGFIMLTILFMIMGFAYDSLRGTLKAKAAFAFLYCLANFFQNFGPNTTTFLIPGEIFPTRYRSTAYGICAASGKLGAVVAQIGFNRIQVNQAIKNDPTTSTENGAIESVKKILQLIAFFMLSGVLSTLLLPETKGQSLEDLSNEEEQTSYELLPTHTEAGS